jgi:hypothetical protein
MAVSGKKEDLLAFAKKASQQHETQWLTEKWKRNEDGTNTEVPEEERKIEKELSPPSPISFWNFLAPTEEELPYYFGHATKPEDEPDPDATQEERLAKALLFEGSGWYNWNIRNWGTKWDANDECLNTELSELDDSLNNSLSYSFSTAWSPAEGAFRAMTEQHPELTFEFHCEEEQGWGVVFDGQDGSLSVSKEWDIPQSHADYVELDREDSCSCGNSEDEDEWYPDCPRPSVEVVVVVEHRYKITAPTIAEAWELALNGKPDELSASLIEGETNAFVIGEDGKRIYPTLENA